MKFGFRWSLQQCRYTGGMLTSLRYALATFCFAASVGCLALWWRSYWFSDLLISPSRPGGYEFVYGSITGTVYLIIDESMLPAMTWEFSVDSVALEVNDGPPSMFGVDEVGIHFPHWYPALAFALAGVGVLRFRRQFSIRSALIAFAVVAALLAMPAVL
ncbi:hypothetical protein [Lacipirellula limnantheis]|uniref:Uncharacterized protein n=1 Tax=Lacipirellula limnantheis TaxID=2528024 RepID=A0A517U1J4_9BACT|nr:hypothetical protein [Lacipirellula limnantheis]QDT74483.1 hypothetical protein I41_36800 [Lacipirellula limnantheis]